MRRGIYPERKKERKNNKKRKRRVESKSFKETPLQFLVHFMNQSSNDAMRSTHKVKYGHGNKLTKIFCSLFLSFLGGGASKDLIAHVGVEHTSLRLSECKFIRDNTIYQLNWLPTVKTFFFDLSGEKRGGGHLRPTDRTRSLLLLNVAT